MLSVFIITVARMTTAEFALDLFEPYYSLWDMKSVLFREALS